MKRADLEHVIRAAAAIVEDDIVVVGSQAILGQFPDAPDSLLFSQEADVYPRGNPERAIEIDGAIGDGSQFHATNGYYAHGVGPETAKGPAGWEKRLVPVTVPARVAGEWAEVRRPCMEAHDLVLSKCVAGRDRDWEFVEQTIARGVVDPDELLRREPDLPVSAERHQQIRSMLLGIVNRVKAAEDDVPH